jgi:hypothetical protein
MFPSIWEEVVQGHYQSLSATLQDHARYAVKSETYPGMIACSGATVKGVLYCNVESEDIVRLDAFEGSSYRRVRVSVRLENSMSIPAATYIYAAEQGLSNLPWQPETFQLQRFFNVYCKKERLNE